MRSPLPVLFWILLAVLTAGLIRAEAGAQKPKPPNVLFLLSDDQRPDTIAALGNHHIKTPNLDRLVREGTVFNRAYCMGSMRGAVCLPSRTMILTGRTLFRIDPTPDIPIFPKAMRQAGYATLRSGKFGNHPRFANKEFDRNIDIRRNPVGSRQHADNAIEFMRGQKKNAPDQPFFLYVAFGDPHDPKVVPKKWMDLYSPGDVPLPANFLPVHPFDNGEMVVRDEKLAPWPRTRQGIREHLADYYSVISYMDFQIGRILQALKDIGEYDNTIIIFASDHGLALGSHGLMGKQNLYEHSMRAPLIFSGPGIPRGKSTDAFAYLLDIFPTVCGLTGTPVPPGVEGKNLTPILQGKKTKVRKAIFTAYKTQRAIRNDRWKLLRYTHINKSQLFDLKNDPHELKNLADEPAYAGRVQRMTSLLERWQKKLGDTLPLTSATPQDPAFVPPSQ